MRGELGMRRIEPRWRFHARRKRGEKVERASLECRIFAIAQKPGFFEIFRLGPQIRPKTRFLRVAALKSRNIRTEVLTTNITLPFIRELCRLA